MWCSGLEAGSAACRRCVLTRILSPWHLRSSLLEGQLTITSIESYLLNNIGQFLLIIMEKRNEKANYKSEKASLVWYRHVL